LFARGVNVSDAGEELGILKDLPFLTLVNNKVVFRVKFLKEGDNLTFIPPVGGW